MLSCMPFRDYLFPVILKKLMFDRYSRVLKYEILININFSLWKLVLCKYKSHLPKMYFAYSARIFVRGRTFDSEFNHWSTNPTKWSNTLKQFVSKLSTNCLSVFDHFMRLALKRSKVLRVSDCYFMWGTKSHIFGPR